jgi:hypothetical protein
MALTGDKTNNSGMPYFILGKLVVILGVGGHFWSSPGRESWEILKSSPILDFNHD